jgi:hypothetical protein
LHSPLQHLTDVHHFGRLRPVQPTVETWPERRSDGQTGVADGDAIESIGLLSCHPKPNQAAPVLGEHRGGGKADRVEELTQPDHMAGVGVGSSIDRLVRPAEPDQIRHHTPKPGRSQSRNHAPVQKALML